MDLTIRELAEEVAGAAYPVIQGAAGDPATVASAVGFTTRRPAGLSLEADGLRWIPGAALEFGTDGFGIFRRSMSLPVALYTNVLVACCWTTS